MDCHRHSGISARRKCYQCGKPVCKACQQKAEHHIFCGAECARAHHWKRLAKKTDRTLKQPVSRWWMVGALVLLGLAFLLGVQYLLLEFIIPTYAPGTGGRRGPGPEVSLTWSRGDPLYTFTGQSPGDGLLVFPQAPGGLSWLPVLEGRFKFACAASGIRPESGWWMPSRPLPFSIDYARGPLTAPLVSPTFDAGADIRGAPELLDLLESEGIRTTLFLTGDFIHRHPELVRRILKDGHEIGNHTFGHPRLTTYAQNFAQQTLEGMTRERLWNELGQAELALQEAAGARFSSYWRAPFGEHNDTLRLWAWQRGYLHIGWTWDSLDWRLEGRGDLPAGGSMLQRFAEWERRGPSAMNGAILLFHLGAYRTEEVREILDRLRQRGLVPVPVSTLLASQAAGGVK
jgi:peptidoglycan/xylan/chitin deacetylase (PgdA/CDA1 family)